jgi:hypothetical protein
MIVTVIDGEFRSVAQLSTCHYTIDLCMVHVAHLLKLFCLPFLCPCDEAADPLKNDMLLFAIVHWRWVLYREHLVCCYCHILTGNKLIQFRDLPTEKPSWQPSMQEDLNVLNQLNITTYQTHTMLKWNAC